MDIQIKDTVTLSDDKEYVVLSKVEYEGKTYYCIADLNDEKNVRVCEERKFYLVDVENIPLKQKLLPLFANEAKKELEKMKNNRK